jgi:hypothetical protein
MALSAGSRELPEKRPLKFEKAPVTGKMMVLRRGSPVKLVMLPLLPPWVTVTEDGKLYPAAGYRITVAV